MGLSESLKSADLIVVGSGFFGATVAERAVSELGVRVAVIERRDHIGGNAHSYVEPTTGIEIHKYGTHIFHTSNAAVWEYANLFTQFNGYQHSVVTNHDGRIFQMPINLGTLCEFYGRSLSPAEARELVKREADLGGLVPSNFEEKAISLIGRPLYEALIRGYTEKQWQTNPAELSAEIISRLPVRYTFDNRYFSDTWQGMPVDGYAAWIKRMFSDDRISMHLGTDFQDIHSELRNGQVIVYTGPIDRYFGYRYGQLSWRTLDFETEIIDIPDFQGTSVMNFADVEVPFTRIHEFKHLHPEREVSPDRTVIMKEYSRFAKRNDEPYYPVNSDQDRATLRQLRDAAKAEKNVIFGGRLGSYQYLDMHMAIGSALSTFRNEIAPLLTEKLGEAN